MTITLNINPRSNSISPTPPNSPTVGSRSITVIPEDANCTVKFSIMPKCSVKPPLAPLAPLARTRVTLTLSNSATSKVEASANQTFRISPELPAHNKFRMSSTPTPPNSPIKPTNPFKSIADETPSRSPSP